MKRKLAFLAAAVIAFSAAAVCSADSSEVQEPQEDRPEDYYTYKPYCYFKSDGEDYMHFINDCAVYIDKNDLPDEGARLYTQIYYYDKYQRTSAITVLAAYDSNEILLEDVIPPTEEEAIYEDPTVIISPPKGRQKYSCIGYNNFSMHGIFPVLSENTDDYPLMTAVTYIKKDINTDSYRFYIHDWIIDWTGSNVLLKPKKGDLDRQVKAVYLFESSLLNGTGHLDVIISDRALGDVVKDGNVDIKDAEEAMRILTKYENNDRNYPAEYNAADVNADGVLNDEDIEIIMEYALEDTDMSFYDYLSDREK